MMLQQSPTPRTRGFTLVELMAVVTVVAALASVGLFGVSKWNGKALDSNMAQDARRIAIAYRSYVAMNPSEVNFYGGYSRVRGARSASVPFIGPEAEITRLSEDVVCVAVMENGIILRAQNRGASSDGGQYRIFENTGAFSSSGEGYDNEWRGR